MTGRQSPRTCRMSIIFLFIAGTHFLGTHEKSRKHIVAGIQSYWELLQVSSGTIPLVLLNAS